MKRIGLLIVVLSMLGTLQVETRGGGGHGGGGRGGHGGYHGGGHGGYGRGGYGRGGYGRGGYGYGGGWGWGGAGLATGLVVGASLGAAASSNNSSSSYSNNCDTMRSPLNVYTKKFGDPRLSKESWSNYQAWLANGCQG